MKSNLKQILKLGARNFGVAVGFFAAIMLVQLGFISYMGSLGASSLVANLVWLGVCLLIACVWIAQKEVELESTKTMEKVPVKVQNKQ